MLELTALPAFNDNYIWCLSNPSTGEALVVDPGDAKPVQAYLTNNDFTLAGILVTHHHPDHTGGIQTLLKHNTCKVFGSDNSRYSGVTEALKDGDTLSLLGREIEVLSVPGHTLDHIAFYLGAEEGQDPIVFCGDTLFSGGCGRLFEGSPAQMHASLNKLATLPDNTRVCCAHEYTLANLDFARAVDPNNDELTQYSAHCKALRNENKSTLPSTIAQEKAINPFLRANCTDMAHFLITLGRSFLSEDTSNPADVDIFAALRQAKDQF